MCAVHREFIDAKAVKQLKGAMGGLGDTLEGEQPEAALKGVRGHVVFLENIRKRPVAVTLHEAPGFHHRFDDDGRRVRLIVQVVARIRGGTPFRVIERFAARLGMGLLRPLAKNAPLAVGKLRFGVFAYRAKSPQELAEIVASLAGRTGLD